MSEQKVITEEYNSNEEYGFTVEHPIDVQMISTEYFYLDNLIFEDGSPVYYKRAGAIIGPRERFIDKFKIYRSRRDMAEGKEPACELYLYGYGKESSTTAPKGFKFVSDEYARAVTRPDLFIPEQM